MSNNVQILHYRDHNNGGKLSGTCYIDTGLCLHGTAPINAVLYPTSIRMRLDTLPTTDGCIWGTGLTDDLAWGITAMRSGDGYYIRGYYGSTHHDYSGYILYPGTIYEIRYYVEHPDTSYNLRLDIYTQYHILLYTSVLSSITLSAIPTPAIYLGAWDTGKGPDRYLSYTLYDYSIWGVARGTSTPELKIKLTAYAQYAGVSKGVIADYWGHVNATIYNQPTDFWGETLDISNYVLAMGTVIVSRGNYYEPDLSDTLSITIAIDGLTRLPVSGDIIAINDVSDEEEGITHIYEVTQAYDAGGGTYKIDTLNPLSRLVEISPSDYAEYIDTSSIASLQGCWWANQRALSYADVSGDYNQVEINIDPTYPRHRWYSILYVLHHVIYVLQLDNIITCMARQSDTGGLYGVLGPYGVNYNRYAVHAISLAHADADKTGAPQATMLDIIIHLCTVLRLTQVIELGRLWWHPVMHVPITWSDDIILSRDYELIGDQARNRINYTRQQDITTIFAADFTGDTQDFKFVQSVQPNNIDYDCVNQLVIGLHRTDNDNLDPVSGTDWEYIYTQFSQQLDLEYYNNILQCKTKIPLTASVNQAYIVKQDDYRSSTSTITAEV